MKWDEMSTKERDILVYEKLLGWSDVEWRDLHITNGGTGFFGEQLRGHSPAGYYGVGPDRQCFTAGSPTTDISVAWKIINKLQSEWAWQMSMYNAASEVDVVIGRGSATSKSVPSAICKAALKAVGVDIE